MRKFVFWAALFFLFIAVCVCLEQRKHTVTVKAADVVKGKPPKQSDYVIFKDIEIINQWSFKICGDNQMGEGNMSDGRLLTDQNYDMIDSDGCRYWR